MKKILILTAILAALNAPARTFWLGGDISGTTADEARGHFTCNAKGEKTETTKLMKQLGLNAVRLRVWVNPEDGFSSPQDVLKMSQRAKALGMPVMIDFHYSDWWADPGKQNIPAAWKDLDLDGMKKALADHTRETLGLLKRSGIDVRWVQIGNETTNGFLWPMAKLPDRMKEYAELTRAGYEASKSVYPDADVIVHLDNGFDRDLYRRVFDGLKAHGTKWDMIGMSVYPFWAIEGGKMPDAETTLLESVANIREVKQRYGTDVMIVETGFDAREPESGRKLLEELIILSRDSTDGACRGVWYWAPETDAEAEYHLGAFSKGRPTTIMDAFKNASER